MHRKSSWPASGFNTFNTAFEARFAYGKDQQLISEAELIQRRLFKDALDGKVKAIRVVLRIAQAQEDARQKLAVELPGIGAERDRGASAIKAMLLLAISHDLFTLDPWVIDLALRRGGAPAPAYMLTEELARYTRSVDAVAGESYALAEDPPGRGSKATEYKKGQSGNPNGRPKKNKPDLPFSDFWDEIGDVQVRGKPMRMTRLQYVLSVLNRKAINGDSNMTALLGDKYTQLGLQRYKHSRANAGDPRAKAPGESWIKEDEFEMLLRKLRITNRRTKTRVLLEPWVVEAALARLGERRLNLVEQTEVLRSTSKPGTVSWPDWWEIRSHADAKPHIRPERRRRKVRPCDYIDYTRPIGPGICEPRI